MTNEEAAIEFLAQRALVEGVSLKDICRWVKRQVILRALAATANCEATAARLLQVNRLTIFRHKKPLPEREVYWRPISRASVEEAEMTLLRLSEQLAALSKTVPIDSWPGRLRTFVLSGSVTQPERLSMPSTDATTIDLNGEIRALRTRLVIEALSKCAGSRTKAAKMLGLRRTTLVAMIHRGLVDVTATPEAVSA